MANYKRYFNNDFAGCRLLAKTHDVYRDRAVRVFLIPGEWEVVGVTDGTDKWVAPVVADPFRVNVAQLLKAIQAGDTVAVVDSTPKPRRVVVADQEPPAAPRRRVLTEDGPTPATKPRRALVD